MGEAEVTAFLSHLAVERRLAPSTLTQALAALQFLYRDILRRPLPIGSVIPRPRAPVRVPVVLTPDEVRRVLAELSGTQRLIGMVLYGSGLRLLECLTLRVKDLDLDRGEIRLRRGKGAKDRVTVLAAALREPLRAHLARVRALYDRDLASGGGWVETAWTLTLRDDPGTHFLRSSTRWQPFARPLLDTAQCPAIFTGLPHSTTEGAHHEPCSAPRAHRRRRRDGRLRPRDADARDRARRRRLHVHDAR